MPSITENQLNDHIKNKAPDRLYFIYGEEEYMKKRYCDQLISISYTDLPELNLLTLPFDSTQLGEVFTAVNTFPVCSDRRCVVLNDIDADKLSNDDFKALEKIFSHIPEETVLILCLINKTPDFKKGAKWKKLLKLIEKYGCCVEIMRRTSSEICKMLINYAKERGCVLQQKDALYLIEICSIKLHILFGELDKLTSFASNGEITRESIDSLVIKSTEASIFDLSKKVLKKDSNGAFEILSRLFVNREEPVIILATLSTAFCDIYRAKCAITYSAKPDSLTNDFDYRGREFRLRNAARDSQTISLGQAKRCLEILSEADLMLKGSRNNAETILQGVIIELIYAISN